MNDAQEDAPMGAVEWTAMLVFYAALVSIFASLVTGSKVPMIVAAAVIGLVIAWNGRRARA